MLADRFTLLLTLLSSCCVESATVLLTPEDNVQSYLSKAAAGTTFLWERTATKASRATRLQKGSSGSACKFNRKTSCYRL